MSFQIAITVARVFVTASCARPVVWIIILVGREKRARGAAPLVPESRGLKPGVGNHTQAEEYEVWYYTMFDVMRVSSGMAAVN